MATEGDVAALGEPTGCERFVGQRVRGAGAGINHFNGAMGSSVLHPAACEPVSACHRWFLRTAVDGRTTDGCGASSVGGPASL
ncbi:MAG: hypothetical protein ACRDS0_14030 [Pseudonocardiaceae bacterium]